MNRTYSETLPWLTGTLTMVAIIIMAQVLFAESLDAPTPPRRRSRMLVVWTIQWITFVLGMVGVSMVVRSRRTQG